MWIRRLRIERKLSQAELAQRLQLQGYDIGHTAISHWETGRNNAPIEDPAFAEALSSALNVDMAEMMVMAGYRLDSTTDDEMAVRAAIIVSHLPKSVQKHALEYLQMLERQHGKATV